MPNRQQGFTLIELMIVVAIIGILASLATSAYQTYSIRAQVAEGISLSANAKTPIVNFYQERGQAPGNRSQAGLTANGTDSIGTYVTAVQVVNGRIDVTYGGRASAAIANQTLSLTPYETSNRGVVWACGTSPAPVGLSLMGTASGGTTAAAGGTTIIDRYLPSSCRL